MPHDLPSGSGGHVAQRTDLVSGGGCLQQQQDGCERGRKCGRGGHVRRAVDTDVISGRRKTPVG